MLQDTSACSGVGAVQRLINSACYGRHHYLTQLRGQSGGKSGRQSSWFLTLQCEVMSRGPRSHCVHAQRQKGEAIIRQRSLCLSLRYKCSTLKVHTWDFDDTSVAHCLHKHLCLHVGLGLLNLRPDKTLLPEHCHDLAAGSGVSHICLRYRP